MIEAHHAGEVAARHGRLEIPDVARYHSGIEAELARPDDAPLAERSARHVEELLQRAPRALGVALGPQQQKQAPRAMPRSPPDAETSETPVASAA